MNKIVFDRKYTMAVEMYSNIYEGNWSYSLYGDQQGIAITEQKNNVKEVRTQNLNVEINASENMSGTTAEDMDGSVAWKVNDHTRPGVRVYPKDYEPRKNRIEGYTSDVENDMEPVCPDTPRPGTGNVLVRHARRRNQDKNSRNDSARQWKRVENVFCMQNPQQFQNIQNADGTDRKDDKGNRPNGRSGEEIEAFRAKLRDKKIQEKKRRNEHALQRELLWKWVIEKSQGQDTIRSKSVNDSVKSNRASVLEDIAEDEQIYSDQGKWTC